MSRPADPSYSVRTFSTDANYPAGSDPWSGQPTKVEPPAATGGFVPNAGAAAEYFNKLFYDTFTAQASSKSVETSLTSFVGQVPFLNWFAPVGVSGGGCRAAVYDKLTRAWYTGADFGIVEKNSANWTKETSTANEVLALSDGTENISCMATDGSGGIVVATKKLKIFARNSTGSWISSNIGGGGIINGDTASQVLYDSAHSLWCWFSADGVAGTLVYTSSDRATWTSRTGPAGFYSAPNCIRMATNGAGRIAVVSVQNFTTTNLATSDDGGISWTTRTAFTTGFNPTHVDLEYNATDGKWMVVFGDSTFSGEVWTSSDAVTWTKVFTATTCAFSSVAPYGAAWVGLGIGGDVCYSLDSGATWRWAGYRTPTTADIQGIFAGDGGFLILTETEAVPSVRAGLNGQTML